MMANLFAMRSFKTVSGDAVPEIRPLTYDIPDTLTLLAPSESRPEVRYFPDLQITDPLTMFRPWGQAICGVYL